MRRPFFCLRARSIMTPASTAEPAKSGPCPGAPNQSFAERLTQKAIPAEALYTPPVTSERQRVQKWLKSCVK